MEGILPTASTTFCQSMSAACAEVTNGSSKTRQSMVCAFAPGANEAVKIEAMIQSILRIVRYSLVGVDRPVLALANVKLVVSGLYASRSLHRKSLGPDFLAALRSRRTSRLRCRLA